MKNYDEKKNNARGTRFLVNETPEKKHETDTFCL